MVGNIVWKADISSLRTGVIESFWIGPLSIVVEKLLLVLLFVFHLRGFIIKRFALRGLGNSFCRGYSLPVVSFSFLWPRVEVHFSRLPASKPASVLSFHGSHSVLLEPYSEHCPHNTWSFLTYIPLWNCSVVNWFFSLFLCQLEGIRFFMFWNSYNTLNACLM